MHFFFANCHSFPCDENFVCKVSPLMIIALLTELHNTGKHQHHLLIFSTAGALVFVTVEGV